MNFLFLRFLSQPLLAVGTFTFQNNRLGSYESLVDIIVNRDLTAAPVQIKEKFDAWCARDKKRFEPRHRVWGLMASRMEDEGSSVADAMRPFISTDEYLIIRAGEKQGDMGKAFGLIVRSIQTTEGMAGSVAKAMSEPVLGLASFLAMSFAYGLYMWKDFLSSIPLKFWPGWVLPCVYTQMWFAQHWYAVFGVVALVVAYYKTRDTWIGESRDWFDKLPPWSIYKGQQAAGLLSVVAGLIEAGETVGEAFADVQEGCDRYMKWQLQRIVDRLGTKEELSALRTGLFNTHILDQVEDASTGREFGPALAHAGGKALALVLKVVNRQAKATGLILNLLVGALFLYMTAVTVFGMQDATDAMFKSIGGSNM